MGQLTFDGLESSFLDKFKTAFEQALTNVKNGHGFYLSTRSLPESYRQFREFAHRFDPENENVQASIERLIRDTLSLRFSGYMSADSSQDEEDELDEELRQIQSAAAAAATAELPTEVMHDYETYEFNELEGPTFTGNQHHPDGFPLNQLEIFRRRHRMAADAATETYSEEDESQQHRQDLLRDLHIERNPDTGEYYLAPRPPQTLRDAWTEQEAPAPITTRPSSRRHYSSSFGNLDNASHGRRSSPMHRPSSRLVRRRPSSLSSNGGAIRRRLNEEFFVQRSQDFISVVEDAARHDEALSSLRGR